MARALTARIVERTIATGGAAVGRRIASLMAAISTGSTGKNNSSHLLSPASRPCTQRRALEREGSGQVRGPGRTPHRWICDGKLAASRELLAHVRHAENLSTQAASAAVFRAAQPTRAEHLVLVPAQAGTLQRPLVVEIAEHSARPRGKEGTRGHRARRRQRAVMWLAAPPLAQRAVCNHEPTRAGYGDKGTALHGGAVIVDARPPPARGARPG